jgi:phosphatidylethanolamine/phosphatidyl-N-methylethanolamine N-methyltransferase
MTPHDVWSFFRAWTCDPRRVGAIAPSGAALADIITREITPCEAPVIELGAGTGVFTQALLSRGLREQDLTLVESGSDFASLLQQRFPKARLLHIAAARLGDHDLFGRIAAGAVVSGLPLLAMPVRKVISILGGAFSQLRSGGAFYQFTYGASCPVHRRILDRLGLKATRIGGVLLNVPPATIYRITRRNPPRLSLS